MYSIISCLAERVEHIVDPLGQKVRIFQRTNSICMCDLLRQFKLLEGADLLCHTLRKHTDFINASIGICV